MCPVASLPKPYVAKIFSIINANSVVLLAAPREGRVAGAAGNKDQ